MTTRRTGNGKSSGNGKSRFLAGNDRQKSKSNDKGKSKSKSRFFRDAEGSQHFLVAETVT
jgi:hypothetical protein